MSSRRAAILDAVVARLDAVGKPAGVVVERFTTGQSPANRRIVVYWLGEDLERSHQSTFGPVQVRHLVVRVQFDSKPAEGQPTDQATDDLEVWATRQLLADPQLGGLVLDVAPQRAEINAETFVQTYVRSILDVQIDYDTDLADPAALPGEPPPDEGD